MASVNLRNSVDASEWLEEEKLMLIKCWCRDGYTKEDICKRIGISKNTLNKWMLNHSEIKEALKTGREIVDYKVENALLKSALGYHTKEVKVTTTMRYGKVVETVKEVTEKEQSPNVSAIQCWLYNRLPDKWKKNRDQVINLEEDSNIQVTITRASKNETMTKDIEEQSEDKEWQEELNESITVRGMTDEEKKQKQKDKKEQRKQSKVKGKDTDVALEEEDLDYWPDDWEE